MANAANKFNIKDFSVTGLATFPSANVVYLDGNYLDLAANGQLAYGTLGDCVAAWGSGGAAAIKFGEPSPSNPGLIMVGVGKFVETGIISLATPYISIVGATTDRTRHEVTASGCTPLFQLTAANAIIKNLRLSTPGGAVLETYGNYFEMDNCDISSSNPETPNTYFIDNTTCGSGVVGKMTNMRLEFSTADGYLMQINNGQDSQVSDFILSDSDIVLGPNTVGSIFYADNQDLRPYLRRIYISGGAPGGINIFGGNYGNFNGRIEDVHIEGSGIASVFYGGGYVSGYIKNLVKNRTCMWLRWPGTC